jgi:hypothetical protein
MADRVWQEFYCNDCKGGGYIRVKINMALTMKIMVVCPMCGAKHSRVVENGKIKEYFTGRRNSSHKEEIKPTKAAWSKTPRHKTRVDARNGNVIDSPLNERWFELYGDKV